MQPSDMFVLDAEGEVNSSPTARPPPYKAPKLTECAPLFLSVSACVGQSATEADGMRAAGKGPALLFITHLLTASQSRRIAPALLPIVLGHHWAMGLHTQHCTSVAHAL